MTATLVYSYIRFTQSEAIATVAFDAPDSKVNLLPSHF